MNYRWILFDADDTLFHFDAYLGLREHFDPLVISEQLGVAKPDVRIFEHALTRMGQPPRERF
ncbi:hypothetical protein ACO2Q2_14335 [Dyella sp. KRB-257]|uniref:hypothetical protein n=1 Tax=Dyella sp. KRB-257 TaxID=3400915 RepID=UPI003C10BA0F